MLLYHTDSVDLIAESKDSAADRMPKARQHTVRARLFVREASSLILGNPAYAQRSYISSANSPQLTKPCSSTDKH
jgi:hypothetical protein